MLMTSSYKKNYRSLPPPTEIGRRCLQVSAQLQF
jgi:hypothetical protein